MARLSFLLLACSLFGSVVPASIAINRAGWTVSADSQQTGNEAVNAIDGNPNTFWHTQYTPSVAQLPHAITIDMKQSYLVTAVSYQPRQDGSSNGNIGQHKIELSTDGTNWGSPVVIGAYVNDAETKKSTFVPKPARYVRLTATTEAQGANNQWTSAAEINVFRVASYLDRTAWSVSADSQETAAESDTVAKAVDGNSMTFWHTQYSGTVAPLPHRFQIDQGSVKAVGGFSYLPRPASTGSNGRIGQYNIQVSNDSSTWSQIAAGTWADDATEKVVAFQTSARYFRLNALSEAGNHGNWSSAAEINLIDGSNAFTYTPPSPSKGLWINTVDFPIVPAAAAVLPNGKVLLWSAYRIDTFSGGTGLTQTAIFDPTTGISTQRTITNTQHDMFCPGISVDFNGRVIVTGGNDAAKTSIYDPTADAWTAGPNMQIARGYQATATCSDGRIFNIGGSWSGGTGGKNGEIYNPTTNTWSLLSKALVAPMLTADAQGVYRADNHGWLFGWKNGFVFQAGPSKAMNWYGTTGDGSVTSAGTRSTDGDSMTGTPVMYDAVNGKIFACGGAPNYQTNAARNNAYLITIGTPNTTPTVSQLSSMAFARGFHNSIVLPDGTIFVTGGQAWVEPFTDDTAALTPELWSPSSQTFTQMNPMSIPRTYHSVGLLLPDATVLNGGGGLCGVGCATNHWDAEIYVPPYLLNSDGSRKTRPVISSTSVSSIKVGGSFTATTNGAVSSFSLIRLGTATHTVDTDQRRIALTPTSSSGTTYTLTVPSDSGVALPGYWYLFAIDSSGTPSVAKIIKVTLT
jgi:galactose oxidase